MARPIVHHLDEAQIERLAMIDCSLAEIAAVMSCSVDTLERRYAEVIEKGRQNGKSSLKRKMYEVAQGGNVTMLIWLSKQRLGYSDKIEQTQTTENKNTTIYKTEWNLPKSETNSTDSQNADALSTPLSAVTVPPITSEVQSSSVGTTSGEVNSLPE